MENSSANKHRVDIYPFKNRTSQFHVTLLQCNTCKFAHQMYISVVHCVCLWVRKMNKLIPLRNDIKIFNLFRNCIFYSIPCKVCVDEISNCAQMHCCTQTKWKLSSCLFLLSLLFFTCKNISNADRCDDCAL